MPSNIDTIVNGFPHPSISPIIGMSTYEALAELNLKLNVNSSLVHSNLGNGQLGLLTLTSISTAVYNTLSTIAFAPTQVPQPSSMPALLRHRLPMSFASTLIH
jgi:hypothetical protein